VKQHFHFQSPALQRLTNSDTGETENAILRGDHGQNGHVLEPAALLRLNLELGTGVSLALCGQLEPASALPSVPLE